MSILRKLPGKARSAKPILSPIISRFFGTGTAKPKPDAFPDVPTSAYYDDLVNEAGRSGDLETVRYLLNKRVRDDCFNTNNTFKFITNTEASFAILDDLCQTLGRLDCGFPRKSAFDSLIARLSKLHRIDESLRVVDEMVRGEYGVNSCTFYPILSALCRMKKMEDAWRVMELMQTVGTAPDITAYNFLLTSYCVSGDLIAASGLMKKIEEEGLGADSRTYDALVLGACRAGKVEGALMLLRRMEDDGVPVLYSTHAHVINALLTGGCSAQAVKFVMANGGRDNKLDMENFGVLASKLIKLKRLEEAKLVVDEMAKMGLPMGPKLRDFYECNVKSD